MRSDASYMPREKYEAEIGGDLTSGICPEIVCIDQHVEASFSSETLRVTARELCLEPKNRFSLER